MNTVKAEIQKTIDSGKVKCPYVPVRVTEVIQALRHLKNNKSAGESGVFSDHLIYAPHKMVDFVLTMLFNASIQHGVMPSELLSNILPPIPKAKGIVNDSDLYRVICVSSSVCKLLDWVILLREQSNLKSGDLQFGFQTWSFYHNVHILVEGNNCLLQ